MVDTETLDNDELIADIDKTNLSYIKIIHSEDDLEYLELIDKGIDVDYNVFSENLKFNKEFLLNLVKTNTKLKNFIRNSKFNYDKDIMLKLIINNTCQYYEMSSPNLRDNKEFTLIAVKKCGELLYKVSERLRDDIDVVLEAVKRNSNVFQYASERLRNDPNVVLTAIKRSGIPFEYASETLKNNKNFLLEVLEINSDSFIHFPDIFKKDINIVLAAIKKRLKLLDYVSDELKRDKRFVLEAIKEFSFYDLKDYINITRNFKNDKDFFLKAIKINPIVLKFIPYEFTIDKQFISTAISIVGFDIVRKNINIESLIISDKNFGKRTINTIGY